MVNDAVKTYFEIPEKYFSFMPEYLAPIEMAQKFNIFPIIKEEGEIKLISTKENEKVKS